MHEVYYWDMGDLRGMLAEIRICDDCHSIRPPRKQRTNTAEISRRPIFRARTDCNARRGRRDD